MLSLTACCYLLLRRSNAIVPEVTSPVRLRRWAAAFFASMALSHIWYLPTFYFTASDDILLSYFIGATLDFMTLVPLGIVVLMSMLQDRKRPLWLAGVTMVPIVAVMAVCIASCSITFLPVLYAYYLSLGICLIIYMVHEVRQYGRWLRDNYADLEHKEVWQSLVAIFVCLLILCFYIIIGSDKTFAYIVQVNDIVLIGLLLWRVETLQTLEQDDTAAQTAPSEAETPISSMSLSATTASNIGQLLEQYCEATQLYLRHDIRVDDLCKAIGTNRNYLSQYFTQQHTTYNTYINNLRIEHFVRLYREAIANSRPFTAQQLAQESGFRSYSTFGTAFKQRMGQNVSSWMHDAAK